MHYSMFLILCLVYFIGALSAMLYSKLRSSYKERMLIPRSPAYKQGNRTGVLKVLQTTVWNKQEREREVTVFVEEVSKTGKFSQVKVLNIKGTEKTYHGRVKDMVGEFVHTNQVEWA